MKQCPACRSRYTDDTLQFCLQDGTPLEWLPGEPEEETVVSGRPAPVWTPVQESMPAAPVRKPRSRTGLIVLASAVATLLIFGLVAAAYMIFSRGGRQNAARENSIVNVNVARNVDPKPSVSPTPTPTPVSNTSNSNIAEPTPDRAETEREVTKAVAGWESASESMDTDDLIERYADKIDYYRSSGVNREFVKRDKERAFSSFDSIDFEISDMKITPGRDPETATAEFDKAWIFEGERNSEGKVRSRLMLRKVNGRWLITGEQDIRVY